MTSVEWVVLSKRTRFPPVSAYILAEVSDYGTNVYFVLDDGRYNVRYAKSYKTRDILDRIDILKMYKSKFEKWLRSEVNSKKYITIEGVRYYRR